jgi:hypothetical protein
MMLRDRQPSQLSINVVGMAFRGTSSYSGLTLYYPLAYNNPQYANM